MMDLYNRTLAHMEEIRMQLPHPLEFAHIHTALVLNRRTNHDARRLLGHALLIKRHAGVELAAVYCRFMGVDIDAAVSALARRSTLNYSYR